MLPLPSHSPSHWRLILKSMEKKQGNRWNIVELNLSSIADHHSMVGVFPSWSIQPKKRCVFPSCLYQIISRMNVIYCPVNSKVQIVVCTYCNSSFTSMQCLFNGNNLWINIISSVICHISTLFICMINSFVHLLFHSNLHLHLSTVVLLIYITRSLCALMQSHFLFT